MIQVNCLWKKKARQSAIIPYLLILMIFGAMTRGWAQPSISGFSPSSGPVGTTVTITGAQFDPIAANDIVYFGVAKATVSAATAGSLTVTVPAGSTYLPVTVTCHQLTAWSTRAFLVTFTGGINDFTASSFSQAVQSTVGSTSSEYIPASYAVGDIDGDGKPDVVVAAANATAGLSVYRNTSSSGIFTFSQQSFATGNIPNAVALGDMDGDGLIDVVVAGNHNGVSVLKNQSVSGTVAFSPFVYPAPFGVADSVTSIAIGDIDGDGRPDLAIVHSKSNGPLVLSVYLNTSTGGILSFAAGIDLVPGNAPQHVLIRDLDGDGKSDIVVANTKDTTISVFQNTGSGTALSFITTTYRTGPGPTMIAVGDLDGDGKVDLAVSNSGDYTLFGSNTVSVLLNTSGSSLSFAAAATYTTGTNPKGMAIGDMDGDGKPDLVTGDNAGTVSVLKNTGSGFSTAVSYPAALFAADVVLCDFDGDGYPDIISQSYGRQAILRSRVYIPAVALVPPIITGFAPATGPAGSSVTITGHHFDSVAGNNIVYLGAIRAKVTAGNPSSLTVTVPAGATYAPPSVTTSHLLGAAANLPFSLSFPGGGAAPFTGNFFSPRVDLYAGKAPASGGLGSSGSVAMSDLDGDGKPDLALTNPYSDSIAVFMNTGAKGAAVYAAKQNFYIAAPNDVAIGDIDGDGRPDLVASGTAGLTVWLNTSTPGKISFGPPTTIAFTASEPGFYLTNLAIGDLDGDGQPDIAAAVGGGFSVWKNRTVSGTVSFTLQHEYNTGGEGGEGRMAIADFNGDGLPDIASTGIFGVGVLLNTSSGGDITFGPHQYTYQVSSASVGIAAGDIDGDGLPDLAVVNHLPVGTVSVLRNTGGNGSVAFASQVDLTTANGASFVAITDMNGDGLPDLVVTNMSDGSVSLLKNTGSKGTISFAAHADYPAAAGAQGTVLAGPAGVVAGDLDGDGLPDVAVSNGTTLSLFLNQLLRPVLTNFTPTTVQAGVTVTINGYNLSGATAVSLGGEPVVSFTVVSSTQITAVVSDGRAGELSVTTPYGVATLQGVIFPPPAITGFTPARGPVGTTVTLTGSGFSSTPGNDIVRFGSVQALVLSASATSLTVKAPGGSTYQPISVTVNGLTAWTAAPFLFSFPGIGNQFTPMSFAPHADTLAGDSPQNIAIGDLDGDGKPDLAVPNYNGQTVSILINSSINGKMSVATRLPVASGQNTVAVSLADMNGDGRPDLVLANGQNSVSVLLNTSSNGILSFGPEQLFPEDGGADHVAVGDIDGDGKADLVIGPGLEIGGPVYILRNTTINDSVSFALDFYLDNLILGNDLDGISIRDLDGDGRPELLLSYYDNNSVMILGNTSTNGTISFNQGITLNPGGYSWQIAVGDLDGDGKPDLAVGVERLASPSGITVYRNTSTTGSLSFIDQADMATDGTPYSVAIGDLDGDGSPDIVAGNLDVGLVSVFRNMKSTTGVLSFAQKVDYATGFNVQAVAIGDLDGDGKPDLVTGNVSVGTVSLLRNQIGEPKVVPTGTNPVSGDIVNQLTIDSTVQTLNGSPYVQRHYDIQPANDPAAATATVTLYYTQTDFDAFNAYPNHGADLPQGPGDAAGIANLRIYQYHGFSASAVPGTYSGTGVVINPDDSNIVWNAADQWWEVTFTVTGFSGFFASNASFVYNQTPAPVITADGPTHFCGGGDVLLHSSADTANQWYKNGVLISGAVANSYSAADSGVYTVTTTDHGLTSPPSAGVAVTQSPIPAKPVITLNGGNLQSSAGAGNQWYLGEVLLSGATSQSYHPADTGAYTVRVTVDSCVSPESDVYHYQASAVDTSAAIRMAPNPTKGLVVLLFSGSAVTGFHADIVDMQGRICLSLDGLVNGSQLNLSGLATGIYTARIYSVDGKQVYTVKVLKE